MAWHRAGTANALELSEVVLIYVVAQHNRLLAARHQPVRTYATGCVAGRAPATGRTRTIW